MDKHKLEELTDGLLYLSETDAPLTYSELDKKAVRQWPPASATQFLALLGEETETPAQEITPEKFFKTLRESNEGSEDQVKTLRKALTEELEDLKGYRVGEIEVEIYMLGKDHSGKVCGLQTLSVET